MWLKRLTLEGEIVRNPSVSLSPTLGRKGVLVVGNASARGRVY